MLIMVGGGEVLRDEQIYLAHKCANPHKYLPPEATLDERAQASIKQYKPTDVQLQVWDDLCHVAPTLSFTRPAKYMYRSVAQFGAWALARAQRTEIDILDDDAISIISASPSDDEAPPDVLVAAEGEDKKETIGKAGDPLPHFVNHMIRQRVTRHGDILPLAHAADLPGCSVERDHVGSIKLGPVRKWMEQRDQWETRFRTNKAKVHKRRMAAMAVGYETFGDGEMPPPSALAGRRKLGAALKEKKKTRSYGLALWSLWGSKHDEMTVVREAQADRGSEIKTATADEGRGARPFTEIEKQEAAPRTIQQSRSRSRRRTVTDLNQADHDHDHDHVHGHDHDHDHDHEMPAFDGGHLSPDHALDVGVTGKRPKIDGIAMPFSIKKEADTASMITLTSVMVDPSRQPTPRPMSPLWADKKADSDQEGSTQDVPDDVSDLSGDDMQRPGVDRFVTAVEDLPVVKKD
jgi:hypothetical protein